MNVILTGEKQIGKSTALFRALPHLAERRFGFLTRFDERSDSRRLVISSLDGTRRAAAVCWADGRAIVDSSVFDDFGASLLRDNGELAVMDEIGKFELQAMRFCSEVLRVFDSDCDVLAVVRLETSGWMQELKHRADTAVITVTRENRGIVPDMIASLLGK